MITSSEDEGEDMDDVVVVENESKKDEGGSFSGDVKSSTKKKNRRSVALISSDEDEDEKVNEEDEKVNEEDEKVNEEDETMDFIIADQEEPKSDSAKKKKRPRSRSSSDLDEDDMELLQENLGIKIKKQRIRIRIHSESEDDEIEDETEKSQGLPDLVQAPVAERDADDSESEDGNDFVVDENGVPIKSDHKHEKQRSADPARQAAEDMFGTDFDYGEFKRYGKEEDDDSEEEEDDDDDDSDEDADGQTKKKKARKKVTIFDLYEPKELELRHFTDRDDEIRHTDIPERMQLRTIPVASVPDGSDELEREAGWIYRHGFTKSTISRQEEKTKEDCAKWEQKIGIQEQIKCTLDFIRQQFLEVPFIAFYRKEYVPDLIINDLWHIYRYDELWCKLQLQKRNLRKLCEKMQMYQRETTLNAPLPQRKGIISAEVLKSIDAIETFEELKDRSQHFKLYCGSDVEEMQAMIRRKKAEEIESKRLARRQRKKETRETVVNDEGEDVELTDDDSEESEEEEDAEAEVDEPGQRKQAKRKDPYSLCQKFGLIGLSTKFGLTPEQFGMNLQAGFQEFDVAEEPVEPLKVAAEYKNETFLTEEDVLTAAKFMVATQLATDPLVRKVTREAFYERAVICVHPTNTGLEVIDEIHDCYGMKYLKDKPVTALVGDQWLKLIQAEEQKLVTIDLGGELCSLVSHSTRSFLDEAKRLFVHKSSSKSVTEWSNQRKEIMEIAFKKILYPILRQELHHKLRCEAKDGVLRACRLKLHDWIKVGKYTVSFDDQDQDDWDSSLGCRIMAISYESSADLASYAVLLAADGEVGEFLKLQHLLKRKKSWSEKESSQKQSDLKALSSFIIRKRPHCIVIGAADRTALDIQKDVEELVQELAEKENRFPKIGVFLMDDNLSKVYSNSQRAEQDFRDYPNVLRQAISIGRRMQDPLTEFSKLCGPENEILCMHYHPMQHFLAEEDLLGGITIEFINRTSEVGVDVNQCLAHPHVSNLVQFVSGLGPRKGGALLKTLRQLQSSQHLENREQLVTICHMGPKVLINCAGFIKIDTFSLEDAEVDVEVLDGSRIHNEAYEWARKMAVDALEEEDANPADALEEILREPERLLELDLDALALQLEKQGFGKKSITLQDIRSELHHMYKDRREAYVPPGAEEIFNMVTKETPSTFYVGKLVQAVVTGFAYQKLQEDEVGQAAPLRKGEEDLWQCPFCGQDDFPELSEVWSHLETAGTCSGKVVGARLKLDNGVPGFIPIRYLSDSIVVHPWEKVKPGMHIFCRIMKIKPDRFSVECTCKSSALQDKDGVLKPRKDAFYDHDAEANDEEQEVEKKKQKQLQAFTKRVIIHPNFRNIGLDEAESLMASLDQGDVIFRPSSKGDDRLIGTWKVTDGIYQHVDIREEGKSSVYSLGKSLWIGSDEFEDLEEIISRHITPMASHVRDLLQFRHSRADGGNADQARERLLKEKETNPGKTHYSLSASKEFAGSFMLSYIPTKSRVMHEFVTVIPNGFRFRKREFEKVSALIQWFKEHFRDAIPGAPGGRLANGTAQVTGAAGGGDTT